VNQTCKVLPGSFLSKKERKQETVVNSHQYEIDFSWKILIFLHPFLSPPPHVSRRGILLFSSVLIYLSVLALRTLISCLLSFLLPGLCDTNLTRYIFTLDARGTATTAALRCLRAAAFPARPVTAAVEARLQPATASDASGLPALRARKK